MDNKKAEKVMEMVTQNINNEPFVNWLYDLLEVDTI